MFTFVVMAASDWLKMGGGVACCRRGLLFWLDVDVDVDVDDDDDVKSWWAKVFKKS